MCLGLAWIRNEDKSRLTRSHSPENQETRKKASLSKIKAKYVKSPYLEKLASIREMEKYEGKRDGREGEKL